MAIFKNALQLSTCFVFTIVFGTLISMWIAILIAESMTSVIIGMWSISCLRKTTQGFEAVPKAAAETG